MIGTAYGVGTPVTFPTQQLIPLGGTFFGAQGLSGNPFGFPTSAQTLPNIPVSSLGALNPNTAQAWQQVLQLLQVLPSQLQQIQQLQYVQHHQLQQLLQAIPGQLAQLQQLMQFVPQQIQQLQQGALFQQPFGQPASTAGYGVSTPWGIAPPAIGAQSSHVM
jgi:hypothetical protein